MFLFLLHLISVFNFRRHVVADTNRTTSNSCTATITISLCDEFVWETLLVNVSQLVCLLTVSKCNGRNSFVWQVFFFCNAKFKTKSEYSEHAHCVNSKWAIFCGVLLNFFILNENVKSENGVEDITLECSAACNKSTYNPQNSTEQTWDSLAHTEDWV